MSPSEFGEHYWGRQPLLSSSDDLPSGFDDLLTLDSVDEILSRRGLRTPFIRMAKDGNVIPPARYTRGGGAGAEIGDQVADDRVLALFADGATVVLQALHRLWPPLVDFTSLLSAEIGHPAQVNAYITPASSRGFSAHYDVHDVFVLQVAGEKHWTIHAPVVDAPLRDQPWSGVAAQVAQAAAQEPLIDTVLRPGDALYLPRGFLHSAQALGAVSAHLTVGVHPVSGWDVLQTIVTQLAQDARLRQSLPMGLDLSDPTTLIPHIRQISQSLGSALDVVDAEAAAARLAGRVVASTRPVPISPLRIAASLADLSTESAVTLRPGLRASAARDDGQVHLVLPDRTLTLPVATAKAVGRLLEGSTCSAGSLPGLDDEDSLVLVRRLVREGVLVPAASRDTSVTAF